MEAVAIIIQRFTAGAQPEIITQPRDAWVYLYLEIVKQRV